MVTLVHTSAQLRKRARQLSLALVGILALLSCSLVLSGCGGSIASNSVASTSSGTLTPSSNTVAFGSVAVGQSASIGVTLTNQSSTAVKISQLSVSGQSFSLSGQGTLPVTVAANGSLALTIQFNPTATGAAAGQLSIASNASTGSATSVNLTGTGVPVLSSLSCDSGAIIGAGADNCTVTLNAAADSNGLSVNLASSNAAVTVPGNVNVLPGATSAAFSATALAVTSTQSVTLTASLGGVSHQFALQLGASAPALSLSAATLAFGNVGVNSAITQSITLSSTGTTPVTVSAATLAGTGFSASGQSFPVTLNPGQTATVNVKFSPTLAGTATGQLSLASNSLGGAPVVVNLNGTGIPVVGALTCSAGSMTGSGAVSCTVTLNAAAAAGGFTVGLASSNSLVTVPASITVPAGASSAGFTASVSPSTSAQTATLTASASGVAKTFALQLVADVPTLTLSSSTVSFGDVAVSTMATQTLTLSSTGAAAVTINSSALSGSGFTATGVTFPLTLNPNQTATLTVQFNPPATGSTTGQLTFSSNSADASVKRVALNGRGVPVLSSISCANSSITGAGTDTCTVTLNSTADTSGLVVSLASNNTAVAVPASVTVSAGATSASFTANVSAVSVAQAVTLSARAGGVTKTTGLHLGAASITLQLSSSSLTFGNVNVSAATAQTVTLTSTGAAAVTVSGATVAGSGFTVSGASFPLTLNPQQKATLTVQFSPKAAGLITGQLTISSNSSTGTSSIVNLTGTGVPVLSGLSCSNGSMAAAGTDSCAVSLNTAAPTGGFVVNLSSNNTAVTVPSTVTVPAAASSATFTANVSSVTSSQTATLTASAGTATRTFAVQLGSGVSTLSINAATIGFGSVNLNTPSTQSVTLSSTGTAPVTVTAATVAGTGFTISGISLPLTLNPNQTATISIQFDPTTAGSASGSVTITSNSSSGSSSVITLTGTGVSSSHSVSLSWNAPAISSDPVSGYNVYRSPSGASAYQQLNSSALNQTSYVDTTVQSGKSYDYIVESVDASGVTSSPSNTASATVP